MRFLWTAGGATCLMSLGIKTILMYWFFKSLCDSTTRICASEYFWITQSVFCDFAITKTCDSLMSENAQY
jgi:hypothetical protein